MDREVQRKKIRIRKIKTNWWKTFQKISRHFNSGWKVFDSKMKYCCDWKLKINWKLLDLPAICDLHLKIGEKDIFSAKKYFKLSIRKLLCILLISIRYNLYKCTIFLYSFLWSLSSMLFTFVYNNYVFIYFIIKFNIRGHLSYLCTKRTFQ